MHKKFLSVTTLLLAMSLLVSCGGDAVSTDTTAKGSTAESVITTDSSPSDPSPETTDSTDTTGPAESISDTTSEPEPEPPTLPADAIDVTTAWGVRTGEGHALRNSEILTEKLSALPDGATVYFPEGTYEIAFSMFVNGKKNIRLVGHKATILRAGTTNTSATLPPVNTDALPPEQVPLTAMTTFLYSGGSEKLTVEGFTLDYDSPTSLSGRVLSVSGGTAEIEIADGSPITGGEYATVINTFTEDGVPDRVLDHYAETSFAVEKTGEKTIKVSGMDVGGASLLQKGTRVCLRLCSGRDYALIAQGCRDITFKDITLRSSFNGGIYLGDRCDSATLDRVCVRSDNPEALMSLNADVLHIADMTGKLTVKSCSFERPGDDCVNAHSGAYTVESVTGNTVAMSSPRFGNSATWGLVGDSLAFYDPATFACLGTARITAVDGKLYTLDSVPSGVTVACVVANEITKPTVEIRDCTVRNTRARGFLLQTAHVTVENCTFRDTALAAILIAPDIAYWYEMSPASDVTIRGNTFENCGTRAAGVIQLTASHDTADKTYSSYIHKDIRIENNRFSTLSSPALYALCTQNLTVTGNTADEKYTGPLAALRYCDTVRLDKAWFKQAEGLDVTGVTIAEPA